MKIKKTGSDRVLDIVCYSIVTIFCISVLIPFWNVFTQSITPKAELTLEFKLFPQHPDWNAWEVVVSSGYMWQCFKNTVVRTLLGTVISLVMCVSFTYPLSRDEFPAGKFLLTMITITMFFNGGADPDLSEYFRFGVDGHGLGAGHPGIAFGVQLHPVEKLFQAAAGRAGGSGEDRRRQ